MGTTLLAMLGLSAAALALAPAFMPGDYSWVSNTTSESAAQGVDGAWVARAGFVLFGFAVVGLAAARRSVWGRLVTTLHAAVGEVSAPRATIEEFGFPRGPGCCRSVARGVTHGDRLGD